MNDREMLLKRVQVCDFALYDAALFLDTNPENKEALAYYKRYQLMRDEAANAYISQYGPLAHRDYDGGERWSWVDNPWPWQMEEA